jgi:transposase InsO family protein
MYLVLMGIENRLFPVMDVFAQFGERKRKAWRGSKRHARQRCGGAGEVWQPGDLQHRPGSQFTSLDFAQLESYGIRISMDGKGRSLDNVLVEQLWRSVKYEEVYLHAYGQIAEAGRWLAVYVGFYHFILPHLTMSLIV